jgi:hypothetical protein
MRNEKSKRLILGLGSSASRLIKNYKVKCRYKAEFENIHMEGVDSYCAGLDASDFDRVALRRLLQDVSALLLVTSGSGKSAGEMSSYAAFHALSENISVDVVLSYPLLWEGSRRRKNAIVLHEELKAIGATVSVVDGKKNSDIEFDTYEQDFALLDTQILQEVDLWIAEGRIVRTQLG